MAEVPKKISLVTMGRHDEIRAGAALSPGHLLELDSAGKVVKHNTAGARAERMVAEEDALQGRTIADNYDTSANDLVMLRHALPGDVMFMFIKALSASVAIGAELVSAGDGTLEGAADLASAGLNLQTIAFALEAIDLSASGAVDTRIRVRIV